MEHHHHHHHHHTHGATDLKEMKTAFWLNLSFTIVEFIGGLFTNSFAIVADAFHDLGDSIALGIGIWLEKYAKKKPSVTFTFGYKRFSLLSACVLSTILIVGSVAMIVKSVENFFNPHEVLSSGMIFLAVLGVFINGLAFWRLSKQENKHKANSRAMLLHFLEDVLGWIAVLIGAVVIYFTGWYWIDAVLSFGIALFILYNAIPNLFSVFKIFLQMAPAKIDVQLLLEKLRSVEKVQEIHRLYVWTEDGDSHIATLHALVSEENLSKSDAIREEIKKILNENHIHNTTIQIESIKCCE